MTVSEVESRMLKAGWRKGSIVEVVMSHQSIALIKGVNGDMWLLEFHDSEQLSCLKRHDGLKPLEFLAAKFMGWVADTITK